MEPKTFGRILGIGTRIGSKRLREHVARIADKSASPAPVYKEPGRIAQEKGRAIACGARNLGRALLGPLAHAGGVLWLEITGLFFALFALFFVQNVYRVRFAWRQGPEHTHFLLYALITGIFVWFSWSSFLRARRKGRRGR